MARLRYSPLLLAGVLIGLLVPARAQPRQQRVPPSRPPIERNVVVERVGIRSILGDPNEAIHSRPVATIRKWHSAADRLSGQPPYETVIAHGNLLTTAGATRLLNKMIGAAGQILDATHARIGVGDATTAALASDIDLGASAGSTHRWFQLADSAPTVSTNVLTAVATFGTNDGNFAWQEWGLDFGTASGNTVTAPLFNHKIASLGTKTAGSSWQFTVTETFN